MSDYTKIEWADHIDLNATGRVLGAYKAAADKGGHLLDGREYFDRPRVRA